MNTYGVVIPLYNKANQIERAIRSIASQKLLPDRVILVDDASTDNGVEYARRIGGIIDLEIFQLKENKGVSAARNFGADKLDTDFVSFLDADDFWHPDFLFKVDKYLRTNLDIDLLATAYTYVSNSRLKNCRIAPSSKKLIHIDNYFKYAMKRDLPIHPSAACIKRNVFLSSGGFPADITIGEDQLLWMQIGYSHKMMCLNEHLSYYDIEVHDSACSIHDKCKINKFIEVLETQLANGKVPEKQRFHARRYISKSYVYAVIHTLLADKDAARKLFASNRQKILFTPAYFLTLNLLLLIPWRLSAKLTFKLLERYSAQRSS